MNAAFGRGRVATSAVAFGERHFCARSWCVRNELSRKKGAAKWRFF